MPDLEFDNLALPFVLLTFVIAAAWWLVRRNWAQPARALARTVDALAAGDWHARAPGDGAADMRHLAARVHELARGAERQVADAQGRRATLQALVDALPDPILLTDAAARVALVNAAAARLLGLAPQQVVGRPFARAVNEAAVLDLFERVARDRGVVRAELRLLRDGQRKSFEAHAEPTDEGGALLVLRDVSTMAGALQMKTDFVANASHELRTPISAIKVAFETLQDVYREDAQQTDRCVGVIAGQLKRLEEMLEDLMDLSRVESPDLKPHLAELGPGEAFAPVRAVWKPIADAKGVRLVFAAEPAGLTFATDRRLLGLVLKNLVENAIKFTPPGGTVTVRLCTRDDRACPAPTGRVALRVSDTGIGIPPEHRERVFERFYQVDPARTGGGTRGTGLGLAIVKHAVTALGGRVSIDSEPGQGTTVTCEFPDQAGTVDGLTG